MLCLVLFAALPLASLSAQTPYNAMGEKAGEISQHSAILMTRLTAVAQRDSLGNGGFLLIRMIAEKREKPELVFDFYEKDGNLVHTVTREYVAE